MMRLVLKASTPSPQPRTAAAKRSGVNAFCSSTPVVPPGTTMRPVTWKRTAITATATSAGTSTQGVASRR